MGDAEHYAVVTRIPALLLAIILTACDALPRDVAGTSDRVARTGEVRLGLPGPVSGDARRFAIALARETKARIVTRRSDLETLIGELQDGKLDVVVGPVRADGGLATEVTLAPPLDGSDEGDHPIVVRAAARNGEHRWVMTVERVSRRTAAAAGR